MNEQQFLDLMHKKQGKHLTSKADWKLLSHSHLLMKMNQEIMALARHMKATGIIELSIGFDHTAYKVLPIDHLDPELVIELCANIANYAYFLADVIDG